MGKVIPGTGSKLFSDRDHNLFDWDWYRNLFLNETGIGTKNDWSRSCLSLIQWRSQGVAIGELPTDLFGWRAIARYLCIFEDSSNI